MSFEYNNAIRNDIMHVEHHYHIIYFIIYVRTYEVLLPLYVNIEGDVAASF